MPRDEKKRQASLQRKATKRKQWEKERARGEGTSSGGQALIRWAAQWPLEECLVSSNWSEGGEMVQVLVARRSPDGRIAAGSFLVDLGSLGVKDAFVHFFDSKLEYQRGLRDRAMGMMAMERADLNLAAKIIREGIAYARQLGFKPHRDYYGAALLLEGADPNAASANIPLGKDGKPFYAAGPYDDVPRIIETLTKAVGPQGFHYMVSLAPGTEAWLRPPEDQDEDEEPDR